MHRILASLIIAFVLASCASATSWSGYVKTDSSDWSIERHSENLSFEMTGSVKGTVSTLDYNGRSIYPTATRYEDIDINDVRLKERTAALPGTYSYEQVMRLCSRSRDSVYMNISKPAGSPVYTVVFSERWPVVFNASSSLIYSGEGINARELSENNIDQAASTLLYNKELTRETSVNFTLERMNATVLATDEAIILARFEPTMSLNYRIAAHTTGIADYSYRKAEPEYDVKRSTYPAIAEADERYWGVYDITRHIDMISVFRNATLASGWLPCCSGGYFDMYPSDRKGGGEDGIFNCTCPKVPESM